MVSCLCFWKNSMYKSAYVNTDFFEQTRMGDSYTLLFQVAFFFTQKWIPEMASFNTLSTYYIDFKGSLVFHKASRLVSE